MTSVGALVARVRFELSGDGRRTRARMARYVGPVERPWRCCPYCSSSFSDEGTRAMHRGVCRSFRMYLDDVTERERRRVALGKGY